jgi:HEXXH motif-containing protein
MDTGFMMGSGIIGLLTRRGYRAVSSGSAYNQIDWSRTAEPQADQYDSGIILTLASSTTSPNRPLPYRRTPVGDATAAFDGQVAIRHVYRSLPEFKGVSATHPDAPTDHPNIGLAAEYIRSWPIVFTQCQRLLEAIHPVLDPRFPLESAEIHRGSSSNSYERLFGTVWATIYCPIGLAEAVVHEMAHQKLRALGLSLESATTIVGNDPSELFVSPVVKHRRRPMSAVLHAQYSLFM